LTERELPVLIKVLNLKIKTIRKLSMLHSNNPIIKHKAGLLNLAEELGNVSRACKVMGVSRDTFYRYQELVEDGGIDALINKSRRAPNIKNRVDDATEQAVIAYAVEQPANGQHRTSNELRKIIGNLIRIYPDESSIS
jgi:hypothetical protein